MPVKMRAPNGEEREVSEDQVAHYKARGAVVADNPIRSALMGALPIAGGIGGGVMGGAGGTVLGMGVGGIPGAMAGSAAGAAGGEALRQTLEQLFSMEPKPTGEVLGSIGVAAGGAGALGAIPGAGSALARGAMSKAPAMSQLVMKMLARRVPGVRTAEDASEIVKLLRTKPVAPSAAKRIATTKAAKAVRPPLRIAPKPQPAKTPRVRPSRIRGASAPELERRTAARAQAIGQAPAMGDDNLGALLLKSLELEAEMSRMGLDQATRMTMRNQLGRIVP